ncbi:hypothetical protein JYK14_26225 [Siccirubricoccus sp. KC 17139]|uniref:LysR substrate-binding domain-containing protein n=1 Tax=Siccirubricoccus soli TaxID=2899147 RepID=A0ABT1DCI0_9PROT|nr:hypothetical protein [Siccirubricoccus soli]MCO6419637.1 hypothetical protein [Siccirubricoccus soli]MCP2685772.1 hypothetical protein [Siccirubricoccus soli]
MGLARGPNAADSNAQMAIMEDDVAAVPGAVGPKALGRVLPPNALEFWIPVQAEGRPAFRAWLRLTARAWNG